MVSVPTDADRHDVYTVLIETQGHWGSVDASHV